MQIKIFKKGRSCEGERMMNNLKRNLIKEINLNCFCQGFYLREERIKAFKEIWMNYYSFTVLGEQNG